jgi:hypothetical protein
MVHAVQQRLAAMDNVADAVLGDLHLHHSAFLDQSLATVDGSSSPEADAPRLIGAARIVETYRAAFQTLADSPAPNSADRAAVEKYLDVGSQTLTTFIQSRARACLSVVGADAPEITRLSFVLEMLTTDPDQTPFARPPRLPTWMNHPKESRVLQTFAVQSGYPRIAFALSRASSTTAPADLSAEYLSFLKHAADATLRSANNDAALVCLRDAITVAQSLKDDAQAPQLSFRMAEVLETVRGPQAAAVEMAQLRSRRANPDDYGRASMLRLKYLQEAGQYDILISEASADLNEQKCAAYLPQIMYAAWITARKHKPAEAESWKKKFAQRFPDHPLAADIYFISATDALAAGDYEQARQILQFIEYRFPQSKLIDKVRTIREQLDAKNNDGDMISASP